MLVTIVFKIFSVLIGKELNEIIFLNMFAIVDTVNGTTALLLNSINDIATLTLD